VRILILYYIGVLVTALFLSWLSIESGALARPHPYWQNWVMPVAAILVSSALWPLLWGLVLLQFLGAIRSPITF